MPNHRIGHIFPGDGIKGNCLGDRAEEEVVKAANGCEPREEWRLCRVKPWVDLYYDKNWRLEVIRVSRDYRFAPEDYIRPPRTRDGVGPGMSPDNVAWDWGMPLRTENVRDPDFGLLEIRYYQGVALEIERSPKKATVIGGIYVFPMGKFPRLSPLASEKDPMAKQKK